METISTFHLVLLGIAGLIPVVGFIMTISHARKGETRREQRWRKSHGLLFWTLLPGLAGAMTILGTIGMMPKVFSMIGIVILGISTFASWSIQQKHVEM
jgi:hypothetical protein